MMASPIGEMVLRLIEAGARPEVAAAVVAEAFVAGAQAVRPVDEAAERRRAKDRERKRAVRAQSADIPDCPRNSADSADPLKVPPHPPKITPNSIPDGMANAAAAAAQSDPNDPAVQERQLFERGKQVLGKTAGGMITNLLKAKGRNIALARAAIETAATKENPREYLSGIIKNGSNFNGKRSDQSFDSLRAAMDDAFGVSREPDWTSADIRGPCLDLQPAAGGRTNGH